MTDERTYRDTEPGETYECGSCGSVLDVEPRKNGPDIGHCGECGMQWYLNPESETTEDTEK